MFDPPRTPKAASFSGDHDWRYISNQQPSGSSSSFAHYLPASTTPSTASPSEIFGTAATAIASSSTTPLTFHVEDPFQAPAFAAPTFGAPDQHTGHRNSSFDSYFSSAGPSGVQLSPSLSASPVQFEIDHLKTPTARHFAPFASTSSAQSTGNISTGMSPFLGPRSPMPFPVTPPPQATFGTSSSLVVAEPHIIQPSQHPSMAMSDDGNDFTDITPPKTRPILRASQSHNGSFSSSSAPLWSRRTPCADINASAGAGAGVGTILPPALTTTTVLARGTYAAPPPPLLGADNGQAENDKAYLDRVTSSTSPSASFSASERTRAGDGGQGHHLPGHASAAVPESPSTNAVPHLWSHNVDDMSIHQGSARATSHDASASVTPTPLATHELDHVDDIDVTSQHSSPSRSHHTTTALPPALGPAPTIHPPATNAAPHANSASSHTSDPAGPAGALIMNQTDVPVAVAFTSISIPGVNPSSSFTNLTTNTPLALPSLPPVSSLGNYATAESSHASSASISHIKAPSNTSVTDLSSSSTLKPINNTVHPPLQTITTVHPPLPPRQHQHRYNPSGSSAGPSSHSFASSAPAHQGLHTHTQSQSHPPPLPNPFSTPQIGNLDLSSSSFSSPLQEVQSYTPFPGYASLPPPSSHRSASFSHTRSSNPNILYPYHPYALAAMKAKMEEPILQPGELPAPRPSNSYAALIGEALLAAAPPHQLYVSEISDMIKRKYPYYRQNPSKVYNGVRHQTSMCPAFVKLTRSRGDQSGGAHKWAIRSGYESFFHSGGYHPPATPVPIPTKGRSTSMGGKAKSTAQSKRLAIGISSPDDFRGKKQLHEPFSPSTGHGGPSIGPAYDGSDKPTWYMAEDPEDAATTASPLMPFTPTPTFHNPHGIQLPPPQMHPPISQQSGLPYSMWHPSHSQSSAGLSTSLPSGYYYVPISQSHSSHAPLPPLQPSHGHSQSMSYAPHYQYSQAPSMQYQQPSYGSYPGLGHGHGNHSMASPSPATQYIPTPIAPAHAQLQNVQYGSSPESDHKFAPQSFGSGYGNSQMYQYGHSDDEDSKPRSVTMPNRPSSQMRMGSPSSPHRQLLPMHSSPIA